jgi:peptidoglycan/xylan/chitin deacetylase (PgdA/CDA1 family)
MPPIKSVIRQSVHSLGGMQFARLLNRRGTRILMYHRFPVDTQALEWQCAHIRKHYQPVQLDDWASNANGTSVTNSLIVTVDDGYRDFLLYGFPVFRAFDIPCTVYLVSDFLDGKLWLWWDQLAHAFRHTTRDSLTFTLDREELSFRLTDEAQRTALGADIAIRLTQVTNSERLRLVKLIPELLDVEIPATSPAEYEPLKWDEVRRLAKDGVAFGAHTMTHPILSRIGESQNKREEIEGSQRRIQQELDQPVRHFCYPNGLNDDFDEETVELVKRAGFKTATTTERGLNFRGSHPFELRRLGIDPDLPRNYFTELLAGARKQ